MSQFGPKKSNPASTPPNKKKKEKSAPSSEVKEIILDMGPDAWWRKGVQFQCQGSGKCCTSHGEFGFVFLTLQDRKRFAHHLGISTADFTKNYCDRSEQGIWHLKEDPKNPDCMFLKNKRCSVYEARPTQCRTWPFWPEVMSPKAWKKDVLSFCPGVNKGKIVSAKEIESTLLTQIKAEEQYGR